MVYVELKEDGYTWNETYKSWDRINGAIYGYYEQEETKQINFGQIKLAPGESYEKQFDLKVKDLNDDANDVNSTIVLQV